MEEIDLRIYPENIHDENFIKFEIEKIISSEISSFQVVKRSIDARKKPIYNVRVRVFAKNEIPTSLFTPTEYQNVTNSNETIHIIGAGPAGLFAGLKAIENGVKPIIYERGKNVKDRRRDLAKLNKEQIVNPESNYCFGEGGAGTYSDGKLYTRSKKRGDVNAILQKLVQFGAHGDILVDAHPHIGTNVLPKIIEDIRETILLNGGEIHFEHKLTNLHVENNKITKIEVNHNQWIDVDNIVLATGHSARDIYVMLHENEIEIEFKPFALGVRVEHSQELIDSIQYDCEEREENLPPASYKLVTQAGKRGVYSFCMCPGGIIAPCATDVGQVVTNGWSPSKRNNPYSNSGIVVEIKESDLVGFEEYGPLKGMYFQEYLENKAWKMGGETQVVPAQRMIDFVDDVLSEDLPKTSYIPGLKSVQLSEVLPFFIVDALKKAFKDFGKKMKGYYTNDAVLHGIESRTSSPVRIPRENETLNHTHIHNLYPCAEGAGYAGGIISAAIDGEKCVEEIIKKIQK